MTGSTTVKCSSCGKELNITDIKPKITRCQECEMKFAAKDRILSDPRNQRPI